MKLLLDENLSDRIVPQIVDLFPASAHVKALALARADDARIWSWAKENAFVLVSKDIDFAARAIALGHPPKFIWLRVGNCRTDVIIALLRRRDTVIREFVESEVEGLLVLER